MKNNSDYIIDDDGRMYYNPGDTEHSHMISLTLEDRIQILESTVHTLEERVESLEKKASEK
jgi:uncharacterized protein YceH (UPF0502 family)